MARQAASMKKTRTRYSQDYKAEADIQQALKEAIDATPDRRAGGARRAEPGEPGGSHALVAEGPRYALSGRPEQAGDREEDGIRAEAQRRSLVRRKVQAAQERARMQGSSTSPSDTRSIGSNCADNPNTPK